MTTFRIRDERGQALVFTLLFLTALLGMAALVLDVGSWFRAQRALQSAADAAALAGAQDLPYDAGAARAAASSYAIRNGASSATVEITGSVSANDTITVRLSRPAPGFFARVFGIDSVDVSAKAKARTGGLGKARYAAPIAVDERHPLLQCRPDPCFGVETELDLQKIGPGAFRLLNLDGSRGGSGQQILARWILQGFDGYMPLGAYYSDSGAKFNASEVKAALRERLGAELLFPIYRSVEGEGANLNYEVVGWVGFVVESFAGNGSSGKVDGYFTRVIWEGIQSESASSALYGARAIELVE